MKRLKRIILAIGLLFLVFIGLIISQITLISKPTKGNPIAQYEHPNKALLVIDIQEDFTGTTARPPFPYKDSEKLISTVNSLLEAVPDSNLITVYIRQELDGFLGRTLSKLVAGGVAIKGNPGTAIDQRVSIISDHIFPKPRSDAFSNPEFEKFLIQNKVNTLYLVGLDADGCVHATARGALNRGYGVTIITDAVVLKAVEKWEALLKQYQEEGISLMTSQDFIHNIF